MGGYPHSSRLGRIEARFTASAARVEAARVKVKTLATELHAVEDRWAGATMENCAPAEFAELSARRELLLRSHQRARREADALAAGHSGVDQEYRQASRSLLEARDRLARATYRGDTKTIAECSAQIAGLIEVNA